MRVDIQRLTMLSSVNQSAAVISVLWIVSVCFVLISEANVISLEDGDGRRGPPRSLRGVKEELGATRRHDFTNIRGSWLKGGTPRSLRSVLDKLGPTRRHDFKNMLRGYWYSHKDELGASRSTSEVKSGHIYDLKSSSEVAFRVRRRRAIDMTKVTGIIGPDAVVKLTAVKLMSNIMIATGWIWAGLLYAALSPSNPTLFEPFSFLLTQQSVVTNVFRCVVAFSFVSFFLFSKTVLTVGLTDTMHRFMGVGMDDMVNHLTGEKFLRSIIGRGILGALFQLIGWSLLAYSAGSDVFPENIGRKKRKRSLKYVDLEYSVLKALSGATQRYEG